MMYIIYVEVYPEAVQASQSKALKPIFVRVAERILTLAESK